MLIGMWTVKTVLMKLQMGMRTWLKIELMAIHSCYIVAKNLSTFVHALRRMGCWV
jgi:hypothetical protein